ncbi:MAG: 2Fe-2S iron-sulfur cluster binding domain-containing protein [Gammaproteobacteria bacterium]|nr:2Fe-2S iron-sulfur cluster binding domain-containing protein [Gammaproteobacteria bacterium]
MPDTEFYPLTIRCVRPETETAICITFEVPDIWRETFKFVQGQFLTLQATIDGEAVRRSYSICSGINEDSLRVGIKRVRGGRFSNHANDYFKAGQVVEVMPPQGTFYSPLDPRHERRYMCLAVGSGITPILSIIKSILATEPRSQVTLIYGNRRTGSIMFREELGFLKNRYLARLHWINILSDEDQGSDLLNGIIDNRKGYQLARHGLIDIRATDHAFICGPEAMMSEVSRGFRMEGLADSQIHYELFASSSEDSRRMLEKAQQRVAAHGETESSEITLVADGRATRFPLAMAGENILDAGLHQGLVLPYACKAGVCSTCKARLVQGRVDMDITHGLQPREIEAGFILTCQAHPVSRQVVVDFDQR